MVTDDCAASFVRSDRLHVRQRDGSRAEFCPIPVTGRIRVSRCYAHAIGLGLIRATRGY